MIEPLARSQSPTEGRITGRVTDPDDAAIPAVDVVALNQETGVSAITQTNESRLYTFAAPQPGTLGDLHDLSYPARV